MRKVITYGTFDLFHLGHLRLLERLRLLGDHLTVAISTDEFNAVKGKRAVVPWEERAAIVLACKHVDSVIPEHTWEQKRTDIEALGIAVFGMGSDWAGKFDDLRDLCNVVYLPRTEGISSTMLKERVHAWNAGRVPVLKVAV